MLALVALVCSCEPEEELASFNLSAAIEGLVDEDQEVPSSTGSKVYMVNEKWTYWEVDDIISLGSDRTSGRGYMAQLIPSSLSQTDDWEDFNGIFVSSLPATSRYFLGLYPYNPENIIKGTGGSNTFSEVVINLPSEQPLVSDVTYAKNVFPMVAWYGGEWDSPQYTPYNLDFHSLAGVVRFQFYNTTGTDLTLYDIEFMSNKPLCGAFDVSDYKTYNPKLKAKSNSDATKKINVSCGENGVSFRSGSSEDLITVYLVVPSTMGSNQAEYHTMRVCLYTDKEHSDPGTIYVETQEGGVKVRRSTITYARAVNVDQLNGSGGFELATSLSGHGTKERPFRIYTLKDMKYLREQFKNSHPSAGEHAYINNQEVTNDTYFKIMRNDILLTSETWEGGIPNFMGHMTYEANPASSISYKGIINNSNYPIFQSIEPGAVVEGITVYRKSNAVYEGTEAFSPFCFQNNGTIRDCRVVSIATEASSTTSVTDAIVTRHANTAGICCRNSATGVIENCGNMAVMKAENSGINIAGICGINHGTIKGCYVSSPFNVAGAAMAGAICAENEPTGVVEECYYSASISSANFNIAGIVYDNEGTVNNCYFSHTGILNSTAEVGGIVYNNNAGGLVDYCRFEGAIRGVNVAGIATNLIGGTVRNSFVCVGTSRYPSSIGQVLLLNNGTVAGGLIGNMSGGSLLNSFYLGTHVVYYGGNSSVKIGPLVGNATAGEIGHCYVREFISSGKVFGSVRNAVTYNGPVYHVDGTESNAGETGVIGITTAEAEDASTGLHNKLNTTAASARTADYKTWEQIDSRYAVLEIMRQTP